MRTESVSSLIKALHDDLLAAAAVSNPTVALEDMYLRLKEQKEARWAEVRNVNGKKRSEMRAVIGFGDVVQVVCFLPSAVPKGIYVETPESLNNASERTLWVIQSVMEVERKNSWQLRGISIC